MLKRLIFPFLAVFLTSDYPQAGEITSYSTSKDKVVLERDFSQFPAREEERKKAKRFLEKTILKEFNLEKADDVSVYSNNNSSQNPNKERKIKFGFKPLRGLSYLDIDNISLEKTTLGHLRAEIFADGDYSITFVTPTLKLGKKLGIYTKSGIINEDSEKEGIFLMNIGYKF